MVDPYTLLTYVGVPHSPAGDTVSNMDLRPILAAHRERAERDKDAIMTLVRQQAAAAVMLQPQRQQQQVVVLLVGVCLCTAW